MEVETISAVYLLLLSRELAAAHDLCKMLAKRRPKISD